MAPLDNLCCMLCRRTEVASQNIYAVAYIPLRLATVVNSVARFESKVRVADYEFRVEGYT